MIAAQASLVLACLAGAADLASTAIAVNNGAREVNPLVSTADGGIRWRVAVPVKAAACAAPFAIQKVNPATRKHTKLWKVLGWSITALYSTATVNNLIVSKSRVSHAAPISPQTQRPPR